MAESNRAHSIEIARWMWRDYLRKYRWWVLAAVVMMAIEGSMLGLLSYMIRPMFDDVFIAADKGAVAWVAAAVAGLFLIRAITGYCGRVIMEVFTVRISADLQSTLLAHLLRLDSSFYQDHPPGTLIERVRGDSGGAAAVWSVLFAAGARDFVSLVSLLAVALYTDWVWTLIAILGAPLLLGPISILQRIVRRTAKEARVHSAVLSTRLDESFHGVNTIKLSTTEAEVDRRFGMAMKQFIRAQTKASASAAGIPAMMDIVAAIGFFGVLTYGGLQIIEGDKTVGEFMSFFTAMALIFEPLRRLGNVSGAWQTALASLERVRELLDITPNITSPTTPQAAPSDPGAADIVFKDVHFSYPNQPVLNGVSFTVPAGQTVALVGPSGAGKSTIFNLLTRLVDRDGGALTIGDIPVEDMALPDLRGLFSVVAQDSPLFDESLRDNITLGLQNPDAAAVQSAVDAAALTEFVAGLPNGLDAPAGPRGSALSGGQRQRVAIARALLRDAPILLLDEATSALDTASEAAVQAALEDLSDGRTTLVVAHRLSTVRGADKIVVMQEGRVAEEGRHDELLAKGGLYADLYRLQFRDGAG